MSNFIEEVHKHPEWTNSDILNYYRNLHYTDGNHLEPGIIANAINGYFNAVWRALNQLQSIQCSSEEKNHYIDGIINILTEGDSESWCL